MALGRGRAEALVDQGQDPGTHLFGVEIGRRGLVVLGQMLDLEGVGVSRALGQIGDAHLVDHPLAKRADLRAVDCLYEALSVKVVLVCVA